MWVATNDPLPIVFGLAGSARAGERTRPRVLYTGTYRQLRFEWSGDFCNQHLHPNSNPQESTCLFSRFRSIPIRGRRFFWPALFCSGGLVERATDAWRRSWARIRRPAKKVFLPGSARTGSCARCGRRGGYTPIPAHQLLAWTPTRPALKGVCSVRACARRPRRPGRRGHPQVLVLGPPPQDYCPRSYPEAVCSFERGKTLQAWRGPIC